MTMMEESVTHQTELTGQATETTVPETSVFLNVLQFLHVQTQLKTHHWIFNSKSLGVILDSMLSLSHTVIVVILSPSLHVSSDTLLL